MTADRKVRASLESGSPTFGAQLRHSLTLPTSSARTSTSVSDDLNVDNERCTTGMLRRPFDHRRTSHVTPTQSLNNNSRRGRAQPHAGDCCGHMEPSLRLPRVLLRSPTSGPSSSSRPLSLQNQDRMRIPRDAASGSQAAASVASSRCGRAQIVVTGYSCLRSSWPSAGCTARVVRE